MFQRSDIFDVGFRLNDASAPFVHQLPVFNWFYPFGDDAHFLADPLESLAGFNWNLVRRMAAYIHIPFCDTICSFCPFTRGLYRDGSEIADYVHALIREVQLKRTLSGRLPVDSIFIGGGTPSVMSPKQISELGSNLHLHFDTRSLCEFGVEVEVKSVTREKLLALRDIGVNRLSFGVQTFSQPHRDALNLDAPLSKIETVAGWANDFFPYTNVDMIYGQAGQNVDDALRDVDRATALETTTIDFYPMNNLAAQVRMHDAFRRRHLEKPNAKDRIAQRKAIATRMLQKGYAHINGYSYSRRNEDCNTFIQTTPKFLYHDILYGFESDAIMGYGAGAYSQLPGYNFYNFASRHDYIASVIERNCLPMYGAPTNSAQKGIVTFPYRGKITECQITRESPSEETFITLAQLQQTRLIEQTDNAYEVTEQGWLYYVNMMYYLMPEEGKNWISKRIKKRLSSGHECEDTCLA